MMNGDVVRLCLLVCSVLVCATAVFGMITGVVVLEDADADFPFLAEATPGGLVVAGIVAMGLQAILSMVMTFAVLKMSRPLMVKTVSVSVVFFVLHLALFIFVLLAGNGVFSGNTAEITDRTAGLITRLITQLPDEWVKFQDDRKCCGFTMRATYNEANGGFEGVEGTEPSTTFSGSACNGGGSDALEDLHERFPVFNQDAQDAADADETLRTAGFLCEDFIVTELRDLAQNGGIVLGVLIVIDIISLGCALSLLYSIKIENGGLKEDSPVALVDHYDDPTCTESIANFFCPKKKMHNQHAVIKFERQTDI
mmetsp:Transcript_19732/g.35112  ORF Transcript_19732/g.35112 Transcript_19732/m.35112 type:complete len:311 (-) Transcript_19732:54-986(-)